MMNEPTRSDAANQVVDALEPAFFNACCHPVRLELIRRLVELGSADVGEVASKFDLDRSVISRHLNLLERGGVVESEKDGRHVIYALNGPNIISKFEKLMAAIRALSPFCCPIEEGNSDETG